MFVTKPSFLGSSDVNISSSIVIKFVSNLIWDNVTQFFHFFYQSLMMAMTESRDDTKKICRSKVRAVDCDVEVSIS